MKRLVVAVLFGCSMLALAACDTTTAVPYQPSTANILAVQSSFKSSAGSKVQLADFGAGASIPKPGCRLAGQLDVAPGESMDQYVHNALQQELFMAGVYDQAAPVTITGKLDQVKVNTFGTGSWTLGLAVTSTKDPQGYHVETTRSFATSFSAVSACKNAVDAFGPTVQQLIHEVVGHPGFRKLTGLPEAG